MASVPALTDLTVADLWREVKDPERLWGDVSQHTLRTVKLLLENRMHDELVDYLNAGRFVRHPHRRGYRNGVYRRRLGTTWGTIPDLHTPRSRTTGFRPSVLAHYQQRAPQVDALIRSVFLGGLSTRQVGPLLAPLLQDTVSPTTVSKVTQTLDRAVAAFHTRPLQDRYQYLLLDAVHFKGGPGEEEADRGSCANRQPARSCSCRMGALRSDDCCRESGHVLAECADRTRHCRARHFRRGSLRVFS